MVRRVLVVVALLVAGTVPSVAAQQPDARRQQLRQQVMQRFLQNYRNAAGLDEGQFSQFRTLAERAFEARNELQRRERSLWQALEGQMRPGVAADPDSVTVLLDGLVGIQTERVELLRSEQAEFAAFLTPVQRAQLTLSLRRLQMQIDRVIDERMQGNRPRRQE